jgi:hypothetical protein
MSGGDSCIHVTAAVAAPSVYDKSMCMIKKTMIMLKAGLGTGFRFYVERRGTQSIKEAIMCIV